MRKTTLEQYQADAIERFGPDMMNWKFVCPACGHVASVADYKAAGAPEGTVGFSCVGRWSGAKRGAFEDGKPGPCDYAGGGLFCLNPVEVVGYGRFFEFAEVSG
jgi:hypothetical protein